jgi:hypothetical protein
MKCNLTYIFDSTSSQVATGAVYSLHKTSTREASWFNGQSDFEFCLQCFINAPNVFLEQNCFAHSSLVSFSATAKVVFYSLPPNHPTKFELIDSREPEALFLTSEYCFGTFFVCSILKEKPNNGKLDLKLWLSSSLTFQLRMHFTKSSPRTLKWICCDSIARRDSPGSIDWKSCCPWSGGVDLCDLVFYGTSHFANDKQFSFVRKKKYGVNIRNWKYIIYILKVQFDTHSSENTATVFEDICGEIVATQSWIF